MLFEIIGNCMEGKMFNEMKMVLLAQLVRNMFSVPKIWQGMAKWCAKATALKRIKELRNRNIKLPTLAGWR